MTVKEAEKLVTRICIVLDFSVKKLKSKSRESDIILQRRAFIRLLSNTGMTTKNVGLVFDKDHSSVIFNNRRHKDLLYIKDKIYISMFKRIKKEFIIRRESTKENKKLENEIQYLKEQINILNK